MEHDIEQDLYDIDKNNLFDMKLRLGLVKVVNKYAPFIRLKCSPHLFKTTSGKCTFDLEKVKAQSYKWWQFVDKIDDKVIFNWYNYSRTTRKHQWNTSSLMKQLGVKVDYKVKCRLGLQTSEGYMSAIEDYKYEIKTIQALIVKPKSHKAKNIKRLQDIKVIKDDIKLLKRLYKMKRGSYA
jgi:hypothetical protein